MVSLVCPICAGPSRRMPAHPQGDLYRCRRCTHGFTDPGSIAVPEDYSASYFLEDHKHWFEHPDTHLFRAVLDQVPVGASLMDVGCGRGDFLKFARKARNDLVLTGIDLVPNQNEHGIRFLQGDILAVDIQEVFDAVVGFAVIEHVADVRSFTKRLKAMVRPGGVLMLTTPNDGSALYMAARLGRVGGIRLPFNRLYSRHHLHHFTRRSLRELLSGGGCTVQQHWDHNAPIEAMDLPVRSRLGDFILRNGLRILWAIGKATGRSYQQTVVCRLA